MYMCVHMHIHKYNYVFVCVYKMNDYVGFFLLCQIKSFAFHVPFSSFVGPLFPPYLLHLRSQPRLDSMLGGAIALCTFLNLDLITFTT